MQHERRTERTRSFDWSAWHAPVFTYEIEENTGILSNNFEIADASIEVGDAAIEDAPHHEALVSLLCKPLAQAICTRRHNYRYGARAGCEAREADKYHSWLEY